MHHRSIIALALVLLACSSGMGNGSSLPPAAPSTKLGPGDLFEVSRPRREGLAKRVSRSARLLDRLPVSRSRDGDLRARAPRARRQAQGSLESRPASSRGRSLRSSSNSTLRRRSLSAAQVNKPGIVRVDGRASPFRGHPAVWRLHLHRRQQARRAHAADGEREERHCDHQRRWDRQRNAARRARASRRYDQGRQSSILG